MGYSKNNQTLAGVSLKYLKCNCCSPKVVTYIINNKQIMQTCGVTKCIHEFEKVNEGLKLPHMTATNQIDIFIYSKLTHLYMNKY